MKQVNLIRNLITLPVRWRLDNNIDTKGHIDGYGSGKGSGSGSAYAYGEGAGIGYGYGYNDGYANGGGSTDKSPL